jgi:hypothetical protein
MGICIDCNNQPNISDSSFSQQYLTENTHKETLISHEVSSKNQNNINITNISTSFNTDTQNQSFDVPDFITKSQPNKPKVKLIIKYTQNSAQSHSFISDSKTTELSSFTGVKTVQSFQSLIKHKNTNHKTVMLQPRVEGIVRNRMVIPHYINEEYSMKENNNNNNNNSHLDIEETILPKRQTKQFERKESLLAIDEFIERMK